MNVNHETPVALLLSATIRSALLSVSALTDGCPATEFATEVCLLVI